MSCLKNWNPLGNGDSIWNMLKEEGSFPPCKENVTSKTSKFWNGFYMKVFALILMPRNQIFFVTHSFIVDEREVDEKHCNMQEET